MSIRTHRHGIARIALVVHLLGGLFANLCHDHAAPGGCGGGHGVSAREHVHRHGDVHPGCRGGSTRESDRSCPFTARRAAARAGSLAIAVSPTAAREAAVGGLAGADGCAACRFNGLRTVGPSWRPESGTTMIVWMSQAGPMPARIPLPTAAFLARGPPA